MNKFILILILYTAAINVNAAATGNILKDDSVADADIPTLTAEAGVFDTLSEGIAVSLARCEAEHCVPDVTRDELNLLIKKLNDRISILTPRYQKSGNKQLENILLSYANSRDSYKGFLDKVDELTPAEQTGEGQKLEFKDEF